MPDYVMIILMLGALVAFTFILDSVMLSLIFFMEERDGCLSHVRSEESKRDCRRSMQRAFVIFSLAFGFLIIEIILYEFYLSLK